MPCACCHLDRPTSGAPPLCQPCASFHDQSIDVWDYMHNDHAESEHLEGTHFMSARRFGNSVYIIKGPRGFPFERFDLVGGDIYIRYESGIILTGDCLGLATWQRDDIRVWPSDYRWSPRYVTDGQIFRTGDPPIRQYHQWPGHKTYVDFAAYAIKATIIPTFTFGGNIGTRTNLLVFHHYWPTGTIDDTNKEIYYYDRELGLVLWHYIAGGEIIAQSAFDWRVPGVVSPDGPADPTDLSAFTPCGGVSSLT